MKRKLDLHKIVYTVEEKPELAGYGRCTLGLFFQNLRVSENSNSLLCLRQQNVFLQLLAVIPIISLFIHVPYIFFKGTRQAGVVRHIPDCCGYCLQDQTDRYEILLHNHNICSVCKNGVQVARIQKNPETWFEVNEYTVYAGDDVMVRSSLLMLICMFVDITFYSNHRHWSAHKTETSIVLNDPFAEREVWMPD